MGLVDLILAAAILGGSAWLLYRTLVRQGGACGGCSQAGACRAPRQEVVRLGSGRRTPGG
ncbi:MAG TPA: hypothetical protein VLT61_06445 [Anaeromyxobacteraceae bacterium]|nr:hypothetical protein [Anaeromyxobacteraceae bacterium]